MDVSLWGSEKDIEIEKAIHTAIFPKIPFLWEDFAAQYGIHSQSITQKDGRKWRNAWCDRQLFWAHQNAKRDVFVTSNMGDFGRLKRLPEFATARIMTPGEAVALIHGVRDG